MKRKSASVRRPFLWPLIVAAVACAYVDGLNGPFIFDDDASIPYNHALTQLGPLAKLVMGPDQTTVAGRPVVNLTLAMNFLVGGLNVVGYHVVNVLLHTLSSLVLFGIVRRTLLTPPLRIRFARQSDYLAAAVALLWAVHPLLTESVTYIVQRTELLMGLFFLLTLYGAIRAAEQPVRFWPVVSVACCALGMGSKESMVAAPIIVLLYDRLFLFSGWAEAIGKRWKLYAGLAATWLVLVAIMAGDPRAGSAGFNLGIKWWQYAATQCPVVLMYLRLALWPWPLCLDYGVWLADWPGQVLPGLCIIAALAAGTVWAVARARPIGFLGVWFFLTLAPTSSVLPIVTEVAAERRMYLALAAVVALLTLAAWSVGQRVIERRFVRPEARRKGISYFGWGLTGAVAIVLTMATMCRNAEYRSVVSIWQDTVDKRPQNDRAQYSLGVALANAGQTAEAEQHYREAIRLRPDYADAYSNLGVLQFDQHQFEAATESDRRAIALEPKLAPAYNNLGLALTALNRIDQAIEQYHHAIEIDDRVADYHRNLAIALYHNHEINRSEREYRLTLKLSPGDAVAHNGLGVILQDRKDYEGASAEYIAALKINPTLGDAHFNLANYYALTGKLEAAIQHYRKAIEIDPGNQQAVVNLHRVWSLLVQRQRQ